MHSPVGGFKSVYGAKQHKRTNLLHFRATKNCTFEEAVELMAEFGYKGTPPEEIELPSAPLEPEAPHGA
jgi:hypothetical protein